MFAYGTWLKFFSSDLTTKSIILLMAESDKTYVIHSFSYYFKCYIPALSLAICFGFSIEVESRTLLSISAMCY